MPVSMRMSIGHRGLIPLVVLCKFYISTKWSGGWVKNAEPTGCVLLRHEEGGSRPECPSAAAATFRHQQPVNCRQPGQPAGMSRGMASLCDVAYAALAQNDSQSLLHAHSSNVIGHR